MKKYANGTTTTTTRLLIDAFFWIFILSIYIYFRLGECFDGI